MIQCWGVLKHCSTVVLGIIWNVLTSFICKEYYKLLLAIQKILTSLDILYIYTLKKYSYIQAVQTHRSTVGHFNPKRDQPEVVNFGIYYSRNPKTRNVFRCHRYQSDFFLDIWKYLECFRQDKDLFISNEGYKANDVWIEYLIMM